MGWLILIVLIAPAGLLGDLLLSTFIHGHINIGQWAFTHRDDGTFSRWQIVGQVFLLGPPAIGCLGVLIWCMIDTVRKVTG